MYRICHTPSCDSLKNLGFVGVEFTLQFTFGTYITCLKSHVSESNLEKPTQGFKVLWWTTKQDWTDLFCMSRMLKLGSLNLDCDSREPALFHLVSIHLLKHIPVHKLQNLILLWKAYQARWGKFSPECVHTLQKIKALKHGGFGLLTDIKNWNQNFALIQREKGPTVCYYIVKAVETTGLTCWPKCVLCVHGCVFLEDCVHFCVCLSQWRCAKIFRFRFERTKFSSS